MSQEDQTEGKTTRRGYRQRANIKLRAALCPVGRSPTAQPTQKGQRQTFQRGAKKKRQQNRKKNGKGSCEGGAKL